MNQMNELNFKFGKDLIILAFPCNQFGQQENANGLEILNTLTHVRPGNGFEPNFPIFDKIDVNGKNAHPIFKFLKQCLPFPSDDPISFVNDSKKITWDPVTRSDVAWNFEKFLIRPDGQPYKRYSKNTQTINITNDIKSLLKNPSRKS
ncbi:unnamed protein product [Owenia fusiformis]|uniref:Glutathione peroxidase n=1 Tax=Owenia fusiformis TaxID=6347 RepID=A0A8S4PCF8_OWEFU|nr:unnamed protein product [Owenia fusiformis]